MAFTVQLRGIIVGRVEFDHLDSVRGLARGAFRPGTGYQLVQDVFRLYAEAVSSFAGSVTDPDKLQRYYKARDALGLELLDASGRRLDDVSVHVYKRQPNRRGEALEIEVHTSDQQFWQEAG